MKKYFLLGALFVGIFLIAPAISHGALIPTSPTFTISTSVDGISNWVDANTVQTGGFSSTTVPYNSFVKINWTGAAINSTSCSLNSVIIPATNTPGVFSMDKETTNPAWTFGKAMAGNGSANIGKMTQSQYFTVYCKVPPVGNLQYSTYAGTRINVSLATIDASSTLSTSTATTTTSSSTTIQPTVSIVTKPTLVLTYDSAKQESKLIATVTVKVTAGSTDIPKGSGGYLNFVSLALGQDTSNPTVVLNNEINTYTLITPLSSPVIPAGTSANFKIVRTLNPQQMFAGSYVAWVRAWLNNTATNVGTVSNKVVVVGEKSPYISNVTTPVDVGGQVTITGVRFGGGDNLLIDGVSVSTLKITSPGIITANTKSVVFRASAYNLTTGRHYVQISDAKTGMSNSVGFEITGTAGSTPQATVVGTPTLKLTYDSTNKEAALTLSATIKIIAGSNDFRIAVNNAFFGTLINSSGQYGNGNDQTRNVVAPSNIQIVGDDVTSIRSYVVPAGQTASFVANEVFNPKQMFAGSYSGTFTNVGIANGTSLTSLVIPQNKSAPVTIVGETSPYITKTESLITPGKIMTLTGERLTGITSVFVDKQSVSTTGLISSGSSMSFILPTTIFAGQHSLQVSNANGASNMVNFIVTGSATPNQTVTPQPTATLTANGTHTTTVSQGNNIMYAWSSTNADRFISTYSSPTCGSGTWIASTANASLNYTALSAQLGCTYTITYTATQSSTGVKASDTITVRVVSPTAPPTPTPAPAPVVTAQPQVSTIVATTTATTGNSTTTSTIFTQTSAPASTAPTATLTANGSHSITLSPGSPVSYVWASTNADKFSSTYSSTCGSGSWIASTASGSLNAVIASGQNGCTYTITYFATKSSTGVKASDTVTVKIGSPTSMTLLNNTQKASVVESVWSGVKSYAAAIKSLFW